MRKKQLKPTLTITNIVLGIVIIFTFFAPLITFKYTVDNKLLPFQLSGMSLLVNDTYALYVDIYDTIILKNVLFPCSIPTILMFTCAIIAIFLPLLTMMIKKHINIEKYTYPIHSVLSLIALIMACIVLPTYSYGKISFSMGYGLILLIILFSANLIVSIIVNLLTFNLIKINKD